MRAVCDGCQAEDVDCAPQKVRPEPARLNESHGTVDEYRDNQSGKART